MAQLSAAIVKQARALVQAGRADEARALIAAQPELTAAEAQRISAALIELGQIRRTAARRNRALLGGLITAVLAMALVVILARGVAGQLPHGTGAALIATGAGLAVAVLGFIAGWKIFGG